MSHTTGHLTGNQRLRRGLAWIFPLSLLLTVVGNATKKAIDRQHEIEAQNPENRRVDPKIQNAISNVLDFSIDQYNSKFLNQPLTDATWHDYCVNVAAVNLDGCPDNFQNAFLGLKHACYVKSTEKLKKSWGEIKQVAHYYGVDNKAIPN